MTYLYKRHVEVEVAGFRISEPKISFQIEHQADETTPNGDVTLYNLSKDNEQRIYDRRGPVRLDAGYEGRVATLFEGHVGEIYRARKNMARETKIEVVGAVAQSETLGGMTLRSYDGEETIRSIVLDIVEKDMGLRAESVAQIPADATVEYWAYYENSPSALTAILKNVGMTWYEDDGVIRFNMPNVAQNDAETIRLTPETGLIGSPTVKSAAEDVFEAECESFLMPLAHVGGIIDLESDALAGRFKISGLVHEGDNWTGRFATKYDLRIAS